MKDTTVKRVAERADKWIEYKSRVELIRLTKDRWERLASFPKEFLTDENWNTIERIPEVTYEPTEEVKDEG